MLVEFSEQELVAMANCVDRRVVWLVSFKALDDGPLSDDERSEASLLTSCVGKIFWELERYRETGIACGPVMSADGKEIDPCANEITLQQTLASTMSHWLDCAMKESPEQDKIVAACERLRGIIGAIARDAVNK